MLLIKNCTIESWVINDGTDKKVSVAIRRDYDADKKLTIENLTPDLDESQGDSTDDGKPYVNYLQLGSEQDYVGNSNRNELKTKGTYSAAFGQELHQ